MLLAAAAAVLAAAAAGTAAEPGAPGPYAVQRVEYRLPPVRLPGFPIPVEMLGEAMLPVGAAGPRPLVVVLHGRHSTCRRARHSGAAEGTWPCPAGWTAIPSHRGYRYLTRQLASNGDIAVSVSVNAINARDDDSPSLGAVERAEVLRRHLARWTSWSAAGGDPWGGLVRGRVDAARVVLVGHSRGGEAVAQAVAMATAADPWRVRGLVQLAPTAFGRQVVTGVDQTVVLPYCDGDVNDLQGQTFVDGRRDIAGDTSVRSAVLVMGANHNGFNTVWATDGPSPDDWSSATGRGDDAICERPGRTASGDPRPSRRVTGSAQRAVARAVVDATVRAATADDPAGLAVIDGSAPLPASAGGATVFVSSTGGGGRLLYAPRGLRPAPAARNVAVRVCRGYQGMTRSPVCAEGVDSARRPHWQPFFPSGPFPVPLALEMRWRRSGGTVALAAAGPPGTVDLSGADAVTVRLVADPAVRTQRVALRLVDEDGRAVEVPAQRDPVRLPGPLTGLLTPKLWAQAVRFPLDTSALDMTRVRQVRLVTRSRTGHAWLLDAAATGRPPRPASGPDLPRLAVRTVTLREPGDRGARTVRVPVTVTGSATTAGRVAVRIAEPADARTIWRQLAVPPGATTLEVPVRIRADRRRTGTRRWTVTLMSPSGVTVSDFVGGVRLLDDEPPIRVTAVRPTAVVGEGEDLLWRLVLSRPAPEPLFVALEPVTLAPGVPALASDDVPDSGPTGGIAPGRRAVRLDESFLSVTAEFPTGARSAEVRIPTRPDARRERAERVALRVVGDADSAIVPRTRTLVGVVRDR